VIVIFKEIVMARQARGNEILDKAKELLSKTNNADELRRLQAVIFPLNYGMSTIETAEAIGRGTTWTTNARNDFIKSGGELKKEPVRTRNRAHLTKDEEAAFLKPFIEGVRKGEILVVSLIHEALETHLGHKVAKATTYNLLHRHGWRKLASDKRHVSANPAAQEEWKKNFQNKSAKSKKAGKDQVRSG
jgi:transposase